jgi:hypothetical protein
MAQGTRVLWGQVRKRVRGWDAWESAGIKEEKLGQHGSPEQWEKQVEVWSGKQKAVAPMVVRNKGASASVAIAVPKVDKACVDLYGRTGFHASGGLLVRCTRQRLNLKPLFSEVADLWTVLLARPMDSLAGTALVHSGSDIQASSGEGIGHVSLFLRGLSVHTIDTFQGLQPLLAGLTHACTADTPGPLSTPSAHLSAAWRACETVGLTPLQPMLQKLTWLPCGVYVSSEQLSAVSEPSAMGPCVRLRFLCPADSGRLTIDEVAYAEIPRSMSLAWDPAELPTVQELLSEQGLTARRADLDGIRLAAEAYRYLSCLLSAACCVLPIICCLLHAACCLLPVVYHLLSAACCLLSVVLQT